jgi:DNA topoisomerase-1
LTSTPLGESVLSFVFEHFDTLFNYGFTAQMESRLDKVAEAQEDWKQILRDTWLAYGQTYNALKIKKTQEGVAKEMPERETRKEFSNGLVAVLTRKGPLLLKESSDGDKEKTVFYGWPEGIVFSDLTEQKAIEFSESKQLGMYKGEPIQLKSGKFGAYAEWNGKRSPFKEGDTLETIAKKLEESATNQLRKGPFEIRVGQYGPYIFRWATTGPSRKFVSLPAGINTETVTESELKTIYEAGLSSVTSKGTGSWRGRGGRGRGRGRGQ